MTFVVGYAWVLAGAAAALIGLLLYSRFTPYLTWGGVAAIAFGAALMIGALVGGSEVTNQTDFLLGMFVGIAAAAAVLSIAGLVLSIAGLVARLMG